MENNLRNLKIFGSSDQPGGIYNNVLINGSGDIEGDLQCNSLKINGSGDINGDLKAGFVKINGSGDINGNVEAEDIIINGSGDINGDVICKSIKIMGSGDVDGNVHSDEVTLMGCSDIKGNCETEIFNSRGAFDIEGLLNAGEININLRGESSVKEIGGERIEVRKCNDFKIGKLFKIFTNTVCSLECDVIEGDSIFLENTTADIVRGNDIVIGYGCDIERVEYRNNLEIIDGGEVSKKVKI
ncbi:polymer-forming cytoskeletal protein [Clostridium tepidiprofundi]|uniref:polymer-forming cytoskeletal protein n=1 Tax=Clostridium tepidiprofundi TaxID=420412 RepID=UPI00082A08E8|nr:polymer-forming cytoskeletal protein [Clostridium tepidiprofundi]